MRIRIAFQRSQFGHLAVHSFAMKDQHLHALQTRLHYQFRSKDLLLEALTHPSYTAEHPDSVHNQRLEFLGDAVIQIIITETIYAQYPDAPEGPMTKMRATVTRASSLAQFAVHLGLGGCLRLGRGESTNGGAERESNLCDAFEAVIGAIFVDCDYKLNAVRPLIDQLFGNDFGELRKLARGSNPKGDLQEWTQKHLRLNPHYDVTEVSGPDHDRTYTVSVSVGDEIRGTGTASKRRSAEESAAREALVTLQAVVEESEPEDG
ncbi:MAG: ribonuclease-3 [Rhodothermales bacterium]|jgi:ribonuclease-3